MTTIEEIADRLDDALTDYRTWLPDVVRDGRGRETLDELRSLCSEAILKIDERDR